jgi:hypothetical protein
VMGLEPTTSTCERSQPRLRDLQLFSSEALTSPFAPLVVLAVDDRRRENGVRLGSVGSVWGPFCKGSRASPLARSAPPLPHPSWRVGEAT